jgi:hypothetical protein
MYINSFLCKSFFSDKMQTRKIILSGVIAVFLAMSLTAIAVYAGEIGNGGGPGNDAPQVYLLKKTFDICSQPDSLPSISGNLELPGGSMPPSSQQTGCVDAFGDRFNEYLFPGEQMGVLVAVRDLNGAIDILRADLAVDGNLVAKCDEITNANPSASGANLTELLAGGVGPSHRWFGHDVSLDLAQQPPAKGAADPTGYNSEFDKVYECIFTLTPSLADGLDHDVTVVAEDQASATGISVPDNVWFDPAVSVDVYTSGDGGPVAFADGTAGQTVYSTNTLKIHNKSEGGVDLFAWIAGTDLESSTSPSKCPVSNVLEAKNIEYRCKIGTIFNNPWAHLQNPDDSKACIWGDNCQGATPLLTDDGLKLLSIIGTDHTAECWFRLTYPLPCVGTFDTGKILVFVRAL